MPLLAAGLLVAASSCYAAGGPAVWAGAYLCLLAAAVMVAWARGLDRGTG